MEVIYAALIGIGGTILGACIQAFGPRVLQLFTKKGSAKKEYLWKARWVIERPTNKRRTIEDVIKLKILPSNQVIGEGNVKELGQYRIEGKDSRFSMCLHFYGVKHKEDMAGVVFLRKKPDLAKLEGSWTQVDRDNDEIGGTVEMEQIDF